MIPFSALLRPALAQVATTHFGGIITQRFEFRDGNSAKFWDISQSAGEVTVRFGKIGTNGQTQTKSFADAELARKHVDKLVREKTAKGYVQA